MPSRFHNRKRFSLNSVRILSFKPGLPSKKAAIFKHIIALWIQCPVVSLQRLVGLYSGLDETVVQWEIISNADLPRRIGIAVKRKPVSNKLANTVQGQPLFWSILYRHCNQGNVRVWIHVASDWLSTSLDFLKSSIIAKTDQFQTRQFIRKSLLQIRAFSFKLFVVETLT